MLQDIFYTINELFDRRRGLIPPKEKIFVGSGNFTKIGYRFLRHFIRLGELKPNEKILDVGCGIGRISVPLTTYLSEEGIYEGFDIVADGISWCKEKIAVKYPNFHFHLIDVYNKHYNPKGRCKASEYRFPYNDESFDFISLVSVFTHMLPQDTENYLAEIARVLKKQGRCLITWFLLNIESLKQIDKGLSSLDFKYEIKNSCTINKDDHEAAVAYDEEFVRMLYRKYKLTMKGPIHYGSWCRRRKCLSYQDIIMAIKGSGGFGIPS